MQRATTHLISATATATAVKETPATTGISLATLAEQLTLAEASDVEVFAARWAHGFFVWLGAWAQSAAREDESPDGRKPHATCNVRSPLDDAPRSQSAIEERSELFVYPLRKRVESELAFVSIGRLAGNDVAIRDETISKFHAYVKPDAFGSFVLLQDGRSRNGTFVDGARVARRGEGEPMLLASGQHVRFGSVSMSYLAADAVLELVRAHDATHEATRGHPFPRNAFSPMPTLSFPSFLGETTHE